MKSNKLILLSFLLLGTLSSCDKKDEKDDVNDVITYKIYTQTPITNLQAVVDYIDADGAIINRTVDLPANITIKDTDLDNYSIKGYLKTKDGSNYTGELQYSVEIYESNTKTNYFNLLADYNSFTNSYVDANPEYVKTQTDFKVTWRDRD